MVQEKLMLVLMITRWWLWCDDDDNDDDDEEEEEEEEVDDDEDMMNCTCWIILGNIYSTHKPPSPYSKENNGEGVKHNWFWKNIIYKF